jgi:hypothetical protein
MTGNSIVAPIVAPVLASLSKARPVSPRQVFAVDHATPLFGMSSFSQGTPQLQKIKKIKKMKNA